LIQLIETAVYLEQVTTMDHNSQLRITVEENATSVTIVLQVSLQCSKRFKVGRSVKA